jgi:DNA-binding transcriptional LysR family regulator
MRERMDSWDDLRYVRAIERAGTLSAAARALGCNQSTMTRRLEALHERLGERVLERRGGAYVLTAFGERLRPMLDAMEDQAAAVDRLARGVGEGPRGAVRLTTVETLATYLLAPRLPTLARQHPGIELELDVSRRAADLSRREADLALRLARPRQPGLVAKKVGRLGIGLYASAAYLQAHRKTSTGHRVVAGDEVDDGTPEAQLLATLTGSTRALRTTSWLTQTAAVEAGLGIGALPHLLATARGLRRIGEATAERELWLIVHRDLQQVARVRAVLDFVAAEIRRAKLS